ncbi:hypothetical protein D3C73_1091560 [compost metagenome]
MPRRLQDPASGALVQVAATGQRQAQPQLVRMPHGAFACLEAMAQQNDRAILAGHGSLHGLGDFPVQLVGEGGHGGSRNGAALTAMEWRRAANVTG